MRVRLLTVITILVSASRLAAADPNIEFFEKRIRPVLATQCYECHSAEAKRLRAGLLLDTRDGVRKGSETGPVIFPGKPGDSKLIQALRYTMPKLKMPPKGKLPDSVIADFEKWIALGAPDPRTGSSITKKNTALEEGRRFWAYQPPRPPAIPSVKDATWPQSDIDRFLLAKLESKGLRPVGDADRIALIRRVYYDLIGLPPTPEQVDAFVNDKRPEAFARVVDELLASRHFGERWGRHWLDVARYAESSGGGRSLMFPDAWRYRDYVIDSFNRDKPYPQFIAEQIAGDLLPYSSAKQREEQLIATAFLVLGPTNYERQDKDILETDVIDEQLDTIGRAFLGMTIGCARCHDHKFDPIPTKDYYALAGIMRSTQTLIHDNVSKWVDTPLPVPPEQEAILKKHDQQVAALKEQIRLAKEAEKKAVSPFAKSIINPRELPGIVIDDDQAKKVGAWTHSKFSNHYVGEGYLHDGDAGKGEKTLTFNPEFLQSGRYEVRLAYTAGGNRAPKVPVTILHADGEQTFFVNEQETPPIDGHFLSLGTFRFEKGNQWFVIVSNENTSGHVTVDAVQFLPEDTDKSAPAKDRVKKTPLKSKELEAELKKLIDRAPPRPQAMSVREAAKIEDFFVCIRGIIHNRGESVPRGFLQAATIAPPPTIPANESGRRQLAEWLGNSNNPLTARVMVNRIWHYLFGAGIVRTVDVFGTTGELPSHPELLDYLAIRFVRDGWSVKTMIRSIVLSHTYQLAVAKPHAADPENRLLSRANRRRLDAEAIRDTILTVSGKLDLKYGGPNWKPGTTTEVGYSFDDTRRSVYTPVFRNRLSEILEVFDFPDPNLVSGKRNVSTVSTQALFLLNSPFIIEQSRHAAERELATLGLSAQERIERAYRRAIGRAPTERERAIALQFVTEKAEGEKEVWQRFYQALFGCIDFRYLD